jgi:hypothetical protein
MTCGLLILFLGDKVLRDCLRLFVVDAKEWVVGIATTLVS